ncbi:MAG: glutamyl-tRNA synthetase [Alphaproteobacteria bacterium]|jgi:glutamyl-tRNA synthetase
MTIKLRFAPSPTGYLHVGNIRTALMNSLLCHQQQGTFMLRLDDTDSERSKAEYIDAVRQDLAWLGIAYDNEAQQSKRMERYDTVRLELIKAKRLYPCYETPDELDRKRKRLLAKGKPPIYDRAALALTDEEVKAFEAEGRKPHWRFKLEEGMISFVDLIRGDVNIDAKTVSDPVLVRANGSYLYTLCSVIDDMDFEITHIVRGEDHVTNTATQIQIFQALDGKVPLFAHHPLLTDASGEKLSKRLGGLSVRELRTQGIEPEAILSYLARLGTSDPIVACQDFKEICSGFNISRTSQSAARFVPEDMFALNSQILANSPFAKYQSRLEIINTEIDTQFWEGVKHNIKLLSDVQEWADIIFGMPNLICDTEDQDFIKQALDSLPSQANWSDNVWQIWTQTLKQATNRKGKSLFMPLRKALTGMEHGPEMAIIIMLLGRDKIIKRLHSIAV